LPTPSPLAWAQEGHGPPPPPPQNPAPAPAPAPTTPRPAWQPAPAPPPWPPRPAHLCQASEVGGQARKEGGGHWGRGNGGQVPCVLRGGPRRAADLEGQQAPGRPDSREVVLQGGRARGRRAWALGGGRWRAGVQGLCARRRGVAAGATLGRPRVGGCVLHGRSSAHALPPACSWLQLPGGARPRLRPAPCRG
jgi:hypothetical protein